MAHRLAHGRTSSGWGRQKRFERPVDPLERAGFVSKGDITLLDIHAQESYYRCIMDRYAQFCKDHSGDLDAAFASLPRNPSGDATKNPPVNMARKTDTKRTHATNAPQELSIILVSLRKLREAMLATTSKTPLDFSQDVHIFCIRTALLAGHPPSYYPPLERLLRHLHTKEHPLETSALHEFITYLILDYACRQGDIAAALQLRRRAGETIDYQHEVVDRVISALIHDNWVQFWKTREHGDGYVRTLMDWAADSMQRRALKAIGKSYLTVDLAYLIESCTGQRDGCTWEKLAEKHNLGWKREGNKVVIRARKLPIS
ncbi:hypothetical protein LOZ58_000435 [Ophidiomyces ophidiicola]|nr:hypothetical protein LOZ58_000435 [Ophidiomyces ophidiicola]